MPQNEPNFCVGLKSDLVSLGGPGIDPEVQNHCHLWLPSTGCLSAMDEPNSQSTCCPRQLVPLWALLPKEPQQTALRPPISTVGHEGAALQWDWDSGHPSWKSQPERNPDHLVSLETTYLLLLIPIPFSHLL